MQPIADTPESVTRRVEAAFTTIQHTRMAGVPILNPALAVAAIGTRRWGEDWLTILVTPWCMNILLLPGTPGAWGDGQPGATLRHVLPSGEYAFILGQEPALGRFQMCSLFSPMQAFDDQATAVATAEAAMAELMMPVQPKATPKADVSRRGLFGLRGTEAAP